MLSVIHASVLCFDKGEKSECPKRFTVSYLTIESYLAGGTQAVTQWSELKTYGCFLQCPTGLISQSCSLHSGLCHLSCLIETHSVSNQPFAEKIIIIIQVFVLCKILSRGTIAMHYIHRYRGNCLPPPHTHTHTHTYTHTKVWILIDWLINDCLYSTILCSRADSLRSHVILYEWLAFHSAFLNIHGSGVLTVLAGLVPRETAAVSAQVLCTPYVRCMRV